MRCERFDSFSGALPGFRCREIRGAKFKTFGLDGFADALPKELRPYANTVFAAGVGGLPGGLGGQAVSTFAKGLTREWSDILGLTPGAGAYGGFGGGMFAMPEFMGIEALPPIDVQSIVDDMARQNAGKFDANVEQAFGAAQGVTTGLFEDFNTFVDSVLPGARDLIGSTSREVQNFINKGMPSAVQNNAILRDAGAMGAGGIAGDIAIRRSLYNEAQRDTADVQYGIGQAQSLVDSARNVGMQFAQIEAQNTQAFLGQLNSLTMISPGQAVGFAFDERNYQTGVAQFNATGMYNASAAGAQLGLQQAQFDFQRQQFAAQEQAQRDAQKSALFGLGGTLLGAGLGALTGTGPIGIGIGAQLGGGLGSAVGGNYAGGTQSLLGGIGNYAGYQTGMEQMKLQREQMEQTRRIYQDDLELRRALISTIGGTQAAPPRKYVPDYGGSGVDV